GDDPRDLVLGVDLVAVVGLADEPVGGVDPGDERGAGAHRVVGAPEGARQGHLQGDDLDPFDPHVRRHTCLWRPRPSISSSTTSPSRRYSPVDRATPGGVPVMITSPGSRVMNWLRCQMMWVTEKS